MKLTYNFVLLIFYITATNSSLYTNLKKNIASYFQDNPKTNKQILRTGNVVVDASPQDDDDSDGIRVQQETEVETVWDDQEKMEELKSRIKAKKDNLDNLKSRIENNEVKKKRINRLIDIDEDETDEDQERVFKHVSKPKQNVNRYYSKDEAADKDDEMIAKYKANILKKAKKYERKLNDGVPMFKASQIQNRNERYHMDPVLNLLRSEPQFRRKNHESSSSLSSSSSRELKDWKEEFREMWMLKKFEAINSSAPKGDVVNMVAARPWGVPCGDPNQHDMPWGSCMLAIECEAEYRIYRGDYFCGRTQFVCCALQLNTYDMYQGFDVSFDGKSISTDSDEKRAKNSKEKRKNKKKNDKKRRKQERRRRKRKIKRNIKKIIKEIRKMLMKQYRNGTKQRQRKTKQLKQFVKMLKKQYRADRQSVKDIHEDQMIRIDVALQTRLNHIRDMNSNFMKNSTFREIVVNGTVTKKGARMLVEAYPELMTFFDARRTGGGDIEKPKDYLEYDIEYGYLYY